MHAHRLTRGALSMAFALSLACSDRAPSREGDGWHLPSVTVVPGSSDVGTRDDVETIDDGGTPDDGGEQGGGDGGVRVVAIDVKPGTVGPAPIQLRARGRIPVAILGSAELDVTAVDLATLRFAGAPVAEQRRSGPMASLEDVDGDGREDLVCHFEMSALQLRVGATTAALEGATDAGVPFRGEDAIRLVP